MSKPFISLADFVPKLSKKFVRPDHLKPLTDIFERVARGERVRAVVSVPPRHSKTETLLHGISWMLLQDPTLRICYASYAQRISEKKSRRARELARKAGVPLSKDSKSKSDWRTGEDEGGVWATSVNGSVTGEGFDLEILDDLLKGRADSESGAIRDRAHSWLTSDMLSRLEPGGSVILSMARWHIDDPAGAMIDKGWECINLPALDANDRPLWPERWPAHEMIQIRDALGGPDGYEWQSLYLGNPRGRGAHVFGDVHFYDLAPAQYDSIRIGVDFAYSTKTHADWSVAVVLGKSGADLFVLDVVRARDEPRTFRERVKLLAQTYKGARVACYSASTEMGGVEFFREGGLSVDARVARLDKFSRAIPTAASWNTGKILVPRKAPWLDAFVGEVCGFTGVKDRHDDQVDALAAAYDSVIDAVPVSSWQPPIDIGRGGIDGAHCGLEWDSPRYASAFENVSEGAALTAWLNNMPAAA